MHCTRNYVEKSYLHKTHHLYIIIVSYLLQRHEKIATDEEG